MNKEEKMIYLRGVYQNARSAGLCHTQKEWADLLGIDRTGLSSAMNGNEKALTDSLVHKVEMWAKLNGLEDSPQRQPIAQDIVIPAATATFYENLSETLKNMSQTVRMQQELISQLQADAHVTRDDQKKKIG